MAETEAIKPPPPKPVEQPLKFYISQTNTYLGKTILDELSAPSSGPSVTDKVKHTFYSSDFSIDSSKKEGISDIWKVFKY
jgi:hypothetical protein